MNKGQEFRMSTTRCPHCYQLMTVAQETDSTEPRAPEPDDVSVCDYCAGLSIFKKDGQGFLFLRKYDTAKDGEIEPELLQVVALVKSGARGRYRG